MIAVELSNIVQSQTVVIEEQRASSEIFLAPAVVDPGSLPSVWSHFIWMNTILCLLKLIINFKVEEAAINNDGNAAKSTGISTSESRNRSKKGVVGITLKR